MNLLSFLLGIVFDEAVDFVNDKTMMLKRSIRKALKKIHSYIISCFILTFMGTISLSAFVIKLGINLDEGLFWTSSLTLFLAISALSYGILCILMNKKDMEEEYFQYGEDSPDRIQDMLEEIINQQQAPKPRRRRSNARRGRR